MGNIERQAQVESAPRAVRRRAAEEEMRAERSLHPGTALARARGGMPGVAGVRALQGVGGNRAVQSLLGGASVQQRKGGGGAVADPEEVRRVAATGVAGGGTALPHLDRIQRSFGPEHDLSGVRAHVGGAAAEAAERMGAVAYATGNDVGFREAPDLRTAAHEAAHVVQQRAGVQLLGGVGREGDVYEQNADAVADRVVGGERVDELLGGLSNAASRGAGTAVQAKQADNRAQPVTSTSRDSARLLGAYYLLGGLGIKAGDRAEDSLLLLGAYYPDSEENALRFINSRDHKKRNQLIGELEQAKKVWADSKKLAPPARKEKQRALIKYFKHFHKFWPSTNVFWLELRSFKHGEAIAMIRDLEDRHGNKTYNNKTWRGAIERKGGGICAAGVRMFIRRMTNLDLGAASGAQYADVMRQAIGKFRLPYKEGGTGKPPSGSVLVWEATGNYPSGHACVVMDDHWYCDYWSKPYDQNINKSVGHSWAFFPTVPLE